MNNGIVYVAFDSEYDKIAAHCSAYSRRFTDLPICVITNLKNRNPKWNDVKNVEFIYLPISVDENRRIKTSLIDFTPFDTTLYLDSDSVIQKCGVEKVFEILGDNDLLLNIHSLNGEKRPLYTRMMFNVKVAPPLKVYYGAIFCFNKTDASRNFFATWNNFWKLSGSGRDMPALACSVRKVNMKLKEIALNDNIFNDRRNPAAIIQHEYGDMFFTDFNVPRFNPYKPFDRVKK